MSNQGQIPAELFKVLNKGGIYQGIEFEGFNFDVDLCATEETSRCRLFYKDYLKDRYPSYKMKIQTMIQGTYRAHTAMIPKNIQALSALSLSCIKS